MYVCMYVCMYINTHTKEQNLHLQCVFACYFDHENYHIKWLLCAVVTIAISLFPPKLASAMFHEFPAKIMKHTHTHTHLAC